MKREISEFNQLININVEHLHQGISLLDKISVENFTKKTEKDSGSIGEHFRHVCNFYENFIVGMKNNYINYENRDRKQILETNPKTCLNKYQKVLKELKSFSSRSINDRTVTIINCEEVGGRVIHAVSTIYRELIFLIFHTIHHYALIKYQLSDTEGIVPKNFGVAASTIVHKKT